MKYTIDLNGKTRATDYSWQFGFGNDHAFQMHRTDFCEHLKLAHDELGIKYNRFHGIFDDDMLTLQQLSEFIPLPGADKVFEKNFRQCGHVFDNCLKCGVKPFVELSFMPSSLAKGKKTGLHYKNNICMPKNLNDWSDYIKSFIEFLLDRYGKEEVESWYFEVWNEPDLPTFFAGTQKDYFKLYEVTAKAIKSVDENLKVGGPSTSAIKWVDEFIAFCEDNKVPYDFVSTHHYPGDGFGNAIGLPNIKGMLQTVSEGAKNGTDLGDVIRGVFYSDDKAKALPKGRLTVLDDELVPKCKNVPVMITEWNSMAIFGAPVHDEKYSAAFVVKTCMDLNNDIDGYMFWCVSDIFEEIFQLNKPFVGSFGIISNDGIPKPNFWGFKMLSELYPERLDIAFRTNEDVEYAVFKNGDKAQVLVYAQSTDRNENKEYEVEFELNKAFSSATVEIIDDTHCNPKKLWEDLGAPKNLRLSDVEDIKAKTKLVKEPYEVVTNGEVTTIKTTIRTNDVKLFTLE